MPSENMESKNLNGQFADFVGLVRCIEETQTYLTSVTQNIFSLGTLLGSCQNNLNIAANRAFSCNDIYLNDKKMMEQSGVRCFALHNENTRMRTLNETLQAQIMELELKLNNEQATIDALQAQILTLHGEKLASNGDDASDYCPEDAGYETWEPESEGSPVEGSCSEDGISEMALP